MPDAPPLITRDEILTNLRQRIAEHRAAGGTVQRIDLTPYQAETLGFPDTLWGYPVNVLAMFEED